MHSSGEAAAGAGLRHPHAGRIRSVAAAEGEGAPSEPAGHHHDRLFRPRQRGVGLPGRRLRVSAQALRRRPGGRSGAACHRREQRTRMVRPSKPPWRRRSSARRIDAGGVPRHRPPVAIPCHGADQRRVRHRQGTGGARAAPPQPARDAPFIAINTAAIPRDLLESELFGHERGAFTGATAMRRGRFEQAEGGTLFLDEIGDMPAELQTRLLRVLSDGNFYRVGGHQPIKANVRVIAATHQNLEAGSRQGLFREDLFHRLNVIRLRLPPLRERREDIPLLAKHFLPRARRNSASSQAPVRGGAEVTCRAGLPRQRAPAGKPLPLADRDGAGTGVDIADLPPNCARVPTAPRATEPADWGGARRRSRSAAERGARRGLRAAHAGVRAHADPTRPATPPAGRRIEAAHLLGMLGIGRNTITRKIQELGKVRLQV
jgi:hypothetical protein